MDGNVVTAAAQSRPSGPRPLEAAMDMYKQDLDEVPGRLRSEGAKNA
jgi:hypothetical protein